MFGAVVVNQGNAAADTPLRLGVNNGSSVGSICQAARAGR